MRLLKFLTVVCIASFLTACNSLSVVSDYDKTVDFSKYKSFQFHGWKDNSDEILNDLDKRRIETAFGNELKQRDLRYDENGELLVTLFIITQEKSQVVATTDYVGSPAYGYGYGGYYGYGPGYGWGPGYGTAYTTYDEVNYTVGTLIISVFDAEKKELIWECKGSKTVSGGKKDREKTIAKVAAQMMAQYPIQPTGK